MRPRGPALYLVARFLAGQGLVQAINVAIGMIVVWLLPLHEYGLYVVALMLTTMATVGADLGLAQAVNSLAAKHHDDRRAVSGIFDAAMKYRRVLLTVIVPVVLGVGVYVTAAFEVTPLTLATLAAMVAASTWIQANTALRTSVLNAYHDSRALVTAGLAGAVARLVLIGVCVIWPYAVVALGVTLVGFAVTAVRLKLAARRYVASGGSSTDWKMPIRQFVVPLVPSVLYYVVNGQVGTFLLSAQGSTTAIAEFGALSRLSQVVGLLTPALAFYLQPHFAKLNDARAFRSRSRTVIAMIVALSAAIVASGYWTPGAWLLLLGPKYAYLSDEVVFALACATVSFFGAAVYHIVIARLYTRNQSWYIVLGIASQAAFVYWHGVRTAQDAFLLTLLPLTWFAIVQLINLWRVLKTMPEA